jgi:hypothetical protein
VLLDDYVMRQVRKIAELIASLGARAAGASYEDAEAALEDAYRAVLGMEPAMADRFSPSSLAQMLGDPNLVASLAHLLTAHGDLCRSRGDEAGAHARWERALELLAHAEDTDLRAAIAERLTGSAR